MLESPESSPGSSGGFHEAPKSRGNSVNIRNSLRRGTAKRDLAGSIEQTKLDVRHYAKRQLTWFRQEPGVEWLDGFGDDAAVQERALAVLSA